MNRITLPIDEVIIEDRQRKDLGDISALADSLSRFGLIQPIVINQDKRLLAGGRRITAAKSLGWKVIDVVYRETLTMDECFELELEENVRRKEMRWQERCLTIAKIHEMKVRRNAIEGRAWGYRETGEAFGYGKSSVDRLLSVAQALRADPTQQGPIWQCESIADALRVILKQVQDAALLELAARHSASPVDDSFPDGLDFGIATLEEVSEAEADVAKSYARERYLANPVNDPTAFDSYWAERQAAASEAPTISLRNTLFNQDCRELMSTSGYFGLFDHVITDIPYGIDMDMLSQEGGSIENIEDVLAAHDVTENRTLMADFFPLAFRVLKENGFCITWCDQMLWQYMYDLAIKAGFKVQRWPFVWCKPQARNMAAQYNFTKTTEIAMVCRKGKATLLSPAPLGHIEANNHEVKKIFRHPFAKPFQAWDYLLDHVAYHGQLIYEPFAGGGSGVISMLRRNLRVVATEKEPLHFAELLEQVKAYYRSISPNYKFV